MATTNQLNFVSDVETASRAILGQGRKVKTVTEVLDAAGRNLFELNRIAAALAVKQEFLLLERLDEAFHSVELAPRCVANALKSFQPNKAPETGLESLVLQPYIEPAESVFMSTETKPALSAPPASINLSFAPVDPMDALSEVLSILGPLNMTHRQRVLTCASVYYGVGE